MYGKTTLSSITPRRIPITSRRALRYDEMVKGTRDGRDGNPLELQERVEIQEYYGNIFYLFAVFLGLFMPAANVRPGCS